MTRPFTSENMREAAESIDLMQQAVTRIINAYQIEIRRVSDGVVLEHDEAVLLDWLTGTEIQDDMRTWADEMEKKQCCAD